MRPSDRFTLDRAPASLAEDLSALALAAKASHGYGSERLSAWRSELTISPDYVQTHSVWTVRAGRQLIAWGATSAWGRRCRLDHLWVAPDHQRQGVGRFLLAHLVADTRDRGWRELEILADPLAAGFYRRCGARLADEEPQADGRCLPVFVLPL